HCFYVRLEPRGKFLSGADVGAARARCLVQRSPGNHAHALAAVRAVTQRFLSAAGDCGWLGGFDALSQSLCARSVGFSPSGQTVTGTIWRTAWNIENRVVTKGCFHAS